VRGGGRSGHEWGQREGGRADGRRVQVVVGAHLEEQQAEGSAEDVRWYLDSC